MAWIYKSSSRPEEDYRIEVKDAELNRMAGLWREIEARLRRERPEDAPYLHSIILESGFRFERIDEPFRGKARRSNFPLPKIMPTPLGYGFSDEVRSIVEKREPGVHNYLPLEIHTQDGKMSNDWLLLNICQRMDTIAPWPHSDEVVEVWPDREKLPNFRAYRGNFNQWKGAKAWRDRIKGAHLWYEFRMRMIMMSNELMSDLIEAGYVKQLGDRLDHIYPVEEI